MDDLDAKREDELYEKWKADGLTAAELEEVYRLLGVGAEWSTPRRDGHIRGGDDPWYAANHYDNVILAVEELKAERGGEEI